MSKPYRVIQWATGTVGSISLRHIIENPAYELAGVLVYNPAKSGVDAGDIVGLPQTGILATNDVEKIISTHADCVHFAPQFQDIDMVCRLLRSGKNVVSTVGPFFPTEHNAAALKKIEAACQDGGTSFHGCGIHPGFIGDILPMTLTRLQNRIDRIEVFEIANKLKSPSVYIQFMGFGQTPEEFYSKPNVMTGSMEAFSDSMVLVVTGLGKKIERLSERLELALAKNDIQFAGGVIRAGTIAGEHYEWTAWVDGKPFMLFHLYYFLGDDMEPNWNLGESRHRIVIEGDPSIEMTLNALPDANGDRHFLGITWTALLGNTAIAAVCDAKPGLVTHFDLGVVQPRGLIRESR